MALLPVNREGVAGARGRAVSILGGFTTGQKVLTGLAAGGLVLGTMAVMHLASAPAYQPLFTNLQATDAGAITAQLTSAHVPFQLTDGGATILVPASDVDQERVALAQQGLPAAGNVGFSSLEKSGITTSQFVQQVEYQQALESQLAQTIESIQGVQSAQVNLVVPQQSDFSIGAQTPTTASILVDLSAGTQLSQTQVDAIVHLAASATPDLTAGNVTVVDNHGDVLNAPGSAPGGSGDTDSQQTTAYDSQVAAALTSMLTPILGPGNAAVQVHAVLDFDTNNETISGIQTGKDGKALLAPTSTSTSQSTSTGDNTTASGLISSVTAPATSGTGNSTATQNEVTNAYGTVSQTIDKAPGTVTSTSVAVLLNKAAMKKVSQAQLSKLVAAAAGLNLNRGDQLVVSSMPFAPAPAALSATSSTLVPQAMKIGPLVLLIFGLFFFALRSSKKRRPLFEEIPVGELPSMVPVGDEPTGELPVVGRAGSLSLGPDAVLAQVNDFIDQRPSEAAQLLKMWADERQGVEVGRPQLT